MSLDLLIAGNLIVDDVVYQDGSTQFGLAGGAALYVALGAALWDVEVGIASVIGDDYPQPVLEALASRGIDLGGVRRVLEPGMRTWLLYEGRRRQVVHRLDSPHHAAMSPGPGEIPAGWRPGALHLAPMPLEVQSAWLEALAGRRKTLVSIDPYELVTEASVDRCRRTFRRADLLLLSEDELLLEASLEDPKEGIRRLTAKQDDAPSRLRHVVLKRGSRGGLAWEVGTNRPAVWPGSRHGAVEATGAGDAFAGGLMAGLAREVPFTDALRQGAISASFALDGQGAAALLAANRSDARERLNAWFGADRVA